MKKLTIQDINNFIIKERPTLKLLSTEYIRQDKPLLFECSCGNTFETSFKIIRNGCYSCKECSKKRITNIHKYTLNDVKKWLAENSNSILLSTKYETCKDRLELQCQCKKVYTTTFDDLKNKKRSNKKECPECQLKSVNNALIKDNEYFLNQVKKAVGNEYTFNEKYKTAKTKLSVTHNPCGHTYKTTPDNFINKGRRCPECFDTKNSKWSYAVQKYLTENNITYEKEFILTQCRFKKALPFDFAIFNNDILIGLIEVDGQGHFEPFRFIKDEVKRQKQFEIGLKRDKIKTDFCNENNINLVRIAYFEIDKIKEKLQDMLIPCQAV